MLDPNVSDGGLARMIQTFNETGLATGNDEADAFLRENVSAVLMGILFDQRIRAEVAFTGPLKLKQRLGSFDLNRIGNMDPEVFQGDATVLQRRFSTGSCRVEPRSAW